MAYFFLSYAGGPMTIISADGQPVEPLRKNTFLMTVAETYDVLVTVPDKGAYPFSPDTIPTTAWEPEWRYGSEKARYTMKILLIEDDRRTAEFIRNGLKQEGFVVDCATDGAQGLEMAMLAPYDAAVVDIMLPKLDGMTVIRTLREHRITLPVLVLSAKNSVSDRVKGLHAGGDDYLVKPFAFSELLARIEALIRRSTAVSEPTRLAVSDLSLDVVRRKVFRGEAEIVLQAKEFALLEYLMRHAGRVVSKTMIMENVWEYNFDPQTNVIETRISRLREKVDRPFDQKLIHTIRGAGYILEARD